MMHLESDPNDPTRAASRVRLVLLRDLMQSVDNEYELSSWIFNRVSERKCNVYWRLPWNKFVFSWLGDDLWEGEKVSLMRNQPHTDPQMWKERPEVRVVRIASESATLFKSQRSVNILTFPDGLFTPADVAADTGLFQATKFAGQLRVSDASQPAPMASIYDVCHPEEGFTKIYVEDLYLEESMRGDIRDHFDDTPSQEITPYMVRMDLKPGYRSKKRHLDAATADTNEPVRISDYTTTGNDEPDDGDPYGLKGRCDGVFALYLAAERCGRNPAFANASRAEERKQVAREVFDNVFDEMNSKTVNTRAQPIRTLYGKTRREHAIRLIDPSFNYNEGRDQEVRIDWPPAQGRALLDMPDEKRQPFVTDMLRLIIGGAAFWLSLKTTPPASGTTMNDALSRWLEDHGVIGTQNLDTALSAITWNGQAFQTVPKHARRSKGPAQSAVELPT